MSATSAERRLFKAKIFFAGLRNFRPKGLKCPRPAQMRQCFPQPKNKKIRHEDLLQHLAVHQPLEVARGGGLRRAMKTTPYFSLSRIVHPDRRDIQDEWIQRAIRAPAAMEIQAGDGRIRLWARIPEAGGKRLRVVVEPDGKTVHNAFYDRRFRARQEN